MTNHTPQTPAVVDNSNISPCKQDLSDYVGNIISRPKIVPPDCVDDSIKPLKSKAVEYCQGVSQ